MNKWNIHNRFIFKILHQQTARRMSFTTNAPKTTSRLFCTQKSPSFHTGIAEQNFKNDVF
ncbi:MAG: hypothetical protein D6714_20885 [Bacteroidetes bacterium]|nr:MAG: hypothetical protein D6714_20885 [Bacteroidota bacterium]